MSLLKSFLNWVDGNNTSKKPGRGVHDPYVPHPRPSNDPARIKFQDNTRGRWADAFDQDAVSVRGGGAGCADGDHAWMPDDDNPKGTICMHCGKTWSN